MAMPSLPSFPSRLDGRALVSLACGLGLLMGLALPPSAAWAAKAVDYEPLTLKSRTYYEYNPNAAGTRIEYFEVLPDTRMIGGEEVTVFKTVLGPHDGTETFYSTGPEGLREHGLSIPDAEGGDPIEVVFETPLVILEKDFNVGSLVAGSTMASGLGKAKLQFRVDHVSTVLRFETLDTPIDDLDTVVVQRDITVWNQAGTPDALKQERSARVWYAKGLGPVQTLLCDNRNNCTRRFDNDNPDHVQYAVATTKTVLPEPVVALQHGAALAALLVVGRRRAR